ncbi:hypothetical protein PIB30_040603 [Stylosanthes scabra]|uniref:Uncharacterized protein n=1 Tax=Stylosanthes scabra TaxID=79078 RepID=A0ABU6RES2_9FABA|nr:hypothetical protein [Stylosanthes scabra]
MKILEIEGSTSEAIEETRDPTYEDQNKFLEFEETNIEEGVEVCKHNVETNATPTHEGPFLATTTANRVEHHGHCFAVCEFFPSSRGVIPPPMAACQTCRPNRVFPHPSLAIKFVCLITTYMTNVPFFQWADPGADPIFGELGKMKKRVESLKLRSVAANRLVNAALILELWDGSSSFSFGSKVSDHVHVQDLFWLIRISTIMARLFVV